MPLQWLRRIASTPAPVPSGPPAAPASGRRPVIERDFCTGCGLCVQACKHGCLELIWDFATLVRPQACTGEGRCAEACPESVLRMDAQAEPPPALAEPA